tara:strand:+ start:217 stop:597 length:381 start_codon:yes stop_codon:yes gene_type:complete
MKNTKRYSIKMEQMILKAYKNAPKDQSKEKTAKILRKDFQQVFSHAAVSKLTANGIAQKYYTMRSQNKKIVMDKAPSHDWPSESEKTAFKKGLKKDSFKDAMFEVMKKSDNMTITVKGTEITVVFK